MATLVVVGVTLALFATGKVRASKRATKVFMIAMVGYLVFSLMNLGLMRFGAPTTRGVCAAAEIFGIPLGLFLGVFVVISRHTPSCSTSTSSSRAYVTRPQEVRVDRCIRHHGHGHLAVPRDPAHARDHAVERLTLARRSSRRAALYRDQNGRPRAAVRHSGVRGIRLVRNLPNDARV